MLKKIWNKVYGFFIKLFGSIAIVPSIITLIAFAMAVVLVSIKSPELKSFLSKVALVEIDNIETLRAILTTFLTGLISIIIFSFSMLILVLTRIAASYSPRILNWLITRKNYQVALGVYLGTIVYNLVLLLQLPENAQYEPTYHLAVLIDAFLVFFSLILFVNLINNVSKDIQISNIIEYIYKKTKKRLDKEEQEMLGEVPEEEGEDIAWIPFLSNSSGYLQNVTEKDLLEIAAEHDLKIKTEATVGYYYYKGDLLFCLDKKAGDEVVKEILSSFVFYPGERIQDHSFYGFRQLSEIAVKALSPGINEPRTAYVCVDYLTELLSIKMEKKECRWAKDKKGTLRTCISRYSLQDLIDVTLIPILKYGKKDIHTLENLLVLLTKLGKRDKHKEHQEVLNSFLKTVLIEIDKQKLNFYFSEYLEKFKGGIKKVPDSYFYV